MITDVIQRSQMLRWTLLPLGLSVTFSVTMALAVEPVPAPRLVGEQVAVARQLATLAGCQFAVGEFFIASKNWRDDLLPGVVYLQTPQPGVTVLPGTVLAGWKFRRAADDQAIVTMPDLRKMFLKDARQKLAEMKLMAMPLPADNSSEGDVLVQDQYPQPGKNVFERTSVLLIATAATQ